MNKKIGAIIAIGIAALSLMILIPVAGAMQPQKTAKEQYVQSVQQILDQQEIEKKENAAISATQGTAVTSEDMSVIMAAAEFDISRAEVGYRQLEKKIKAAIVLANQKKNTNFIYTNREAALSNQALRETMIQLVSDKSLTEDERKTCAAVLYFQAFQLGDEKEAKRIYDVLAPYLPKEETTVVSAG